MESDTPTPVPVAEAPPEKKESWGETLRFFLILFVAALALRTFIVAPFSIPSGSMLPNLMIGDYLFVTKWPYGFSRHSFPFGIASFEGRILDRLPDRGDIAVFRYPGGTGEDYVKRVVGLPGDTVEVRGGTVILNGTPLPRRRIADYAMPVSPNSPCRAVRPGSARQLPNGPGGTVCAYPRFRETLPDGRSYDVIDQVDDGDGDAFGPITVPEGHLFVMGDNRDDSQDSRFPVSEFGVGLLPVENLVGEALIAFWSTDGSAEWVKPWTWFTAARWDRIGRTY
ncbi:MAG TPA: signal peptidase I [Allosphingosinicella sp.]|nr:signal peptidase I [Allosphingosinicella sp.]